MDGTTHGEAWASLPSVRRRLLARAAVFAGGALGVAVVSSRGRLRELDDRAFKQLNSRGGAATDLVFDRVTDLGSYWASLGAAGAIALAGKRRAALNALGAATAAWLAGQGLKKVFLRARPYDALTELRLRIGRQRGTSWPSAHPLTLLAFLTVAGHDLGLSRRARAFLLGLAATVGLSRVYNGVHYPSDVVGGLLMGAAVGDAWSALVSPVIAGPPADPSR